MSTEHTKKRKGLTLVNISGDPKELGFFTQ